MNFYWTTERTTLEIVATAFFWLFFAVKTFFLFRRSSTLLGVGSATSRIVLASLLATIFLDPTYVRTVAERTPITIVLDDSASAARPLEAAQKTTPSDDVRTSGTETVWTRTVAAARLAESTARRLGLTPSLQTLSGQSFAATGALPKTSRFETSPIRDVAKIVRQTDAAFSLDSPLGSAAVSDARRVLLLSDGIENAKTSPPIRSNAAQKSPSPRLNAPIDAVSLGVSKPALDWQLRNVAASTVVYPSENASVSCDVSVENAEKNGTRRAVVRLWERAPNKKNVAPKLVWENELDVETDETGAGSVRVEHSWTPRRDDVFDYLIFVSDFEDADRFRKFNETDAEKPSFFENFEFCLFNNIFEFSVVPKAEKLQVLLVDDQPRYEYRYLRELLRREETISLRTLLLSADAETRVPDDATAISLDRLDRRTFANFDVVLVGDVPRERWNGKFERLVDVVLNADSSTSVWFLGGERTSTPEFWSEPSASRLVPNAKIDEKIEPKNATDASADENEKTSAENAWRLVATPSGRRVFPELSNFFDSLESEIDAPLAFSRVFSIPTADASSDVLLTARSDDGRETALFVVVTPGRNKILRQATDELWRIRTLDDKTIYRRLVLRTLEFLTDSTSKRQLVKPPTDADANSLAETAAPQANFESSADYCFFKDVVNNGAKLGVETSDVAAQDALLKELATLTDGAFLDLRDVPETTAFDAATAFFERRFADVPTVYAEKRTRFIRKNAAIPLAFLLFFIVWTLEFRDERKKR